MKNKHEITVKIEGKEWTDALNKSFDKNVKKVKVDGFRQGKCPRDIYEKKFGVQSLFSDAVDSVVELAYNKAMEESKLTPAVQPSLNIKDVNNDCVEFVFTVVTKPEVKINKYKKLGIKKEKVTVSKEEIQKEIDALRDKYAEIVEKDGKIENHDTATIDFEGFVDGKPFQGGKGENYPLEIGSNTFIPGFEEQLIGMKKDEEKEIKVTFPENYPSEDLKGKETTFKVKIHEIKTRKLPELNEEFFEDLQYDVKTLEELENKVKEDIKKDKEEIEENKFIDKILEEIANNTEVEFPEEMIEAEIDAMVNQFREKLKMQSIELEQYLGFIKSTMEEFRNKLKEEASRNLLYRNILEEIKNLEKIEATEEEVKKELEKLSQTYQMTEEELIKAFGGTDIVKYNLEMEKAIKFIKENN